MAVVAGPMVHDATNVRSLHIIWERFFIGRDEISIAEGIAFSELPSGEISNPTTFRIDPKGHWRAGYLQNKMPSRAERTIIRMGEGAAFRSLLQAR